MHKSTSPNRKEKLKTLTEPQGKIKDSGGRIYGKARECINLPNRTARKN